MIEVRKEFVEQLDEVFRNTSKTSDLMLNADLVKEGQNAGEIQIPKMSTDGLGTYDKSTGYSDGSVEFTYETKKCGLDRGRKLSIDFIDNKDNAEIPFARLTSHFIKNSVVPEDDAYTFAQLSAKAKIKKSETIATGDEAIKALRVALESMNEAEVPEENRILYCTTGFLGLIEDLDNTKSKSVLNKFTKIVTVPQVRFYTAIELNDGKTGGQEKGGYKKADEGKDINFMVVYAPSVIKADRHIANNIIEPEENQEKDAYAMKYRRVAICDVFDNQTAGIYVSHLV